MALYDNQTGSIAREVECEIITVLGDDKYEVTFADETFTAVAKITNDKYAVGETVVVGIPQSEEEDTIYILKKVDKSEDTGSETTGSEENSTEEEEGLETALTNNFIPIEEFKYDNEIIMSNSYSDSSYKNISSTPLNDITKLQSYLDQQYNILKLSCKIKTDIPNNLDTKYGEYGIYFRFPIIKDGKSTYKEFYINSDTVYGNPYKFEEYVEQSIIYTWEEDIRYDIKSQKFIQFYTYVKDFNGNTSYDVCYIKDITFSIGYMSSVISDTYNLYLSAEEGIYFTGNNGSSKKITPILYFNNNKITDFDDKEIFWYREDYSVTPNDINFSKDAGIGWKCINPYTTTDNKNYYSSKNIIKIESVGYAAKENKIKCIIKNKNNKKILASNTIIIYNNSLNSTILKLKVIKVDSSIIQRDFGNFKIKAILNSSSILRNNLPYSNISFKVSRYDKNNNYIEDNNIYFKYTSKILSTLEFESNEISVNSIQDYNIFKINCHDKMSDAIYNNASIKIESNNIPLYRLEIIGDKKNYKYNFEGKSPMVTGNNIQHGGINIQESQVLSYKLYDYKNEEIAEEISQEWKVNKNSLIIEGSDTKGKTFTFKLKDGYNYDLANIKPIELIVKYKDITISKKADISFSLEGSEGTYGDKCAIRLVPAKDYPSIDYINNYYNESTPIRFAYYNNKLYYYDSTEQRYIAEDDQKIRFYPILWDSHNFIESSNYSVECSIVDSIKESQEDKEKDDNYTNACLKIDNYIDEYKGFTISLDKNKLNQIIDEDAIIKSKGYLYDYTHDHSEYDDEDDYIGSHKCYVTSEKYPISEYYEGYLHLDASKYKLKKIGEKTYIYDPSIISTIDKKINNIVNDRKQNVNIIKIKISYNKNNYEYFCPIEFYNSEIHPEFLPTLKGYNEIYFKKDGENIITNNKNINYYTYNQFITPANIFKTLYLSKDSYQYAEDDKYNNYNDISYSKNKRLFEENIYVLKNSLELFNLATNKKSSFENKKTSLILLNNGYETSLKRLKNFANGFKINQWLETLKSIKTINISKNNLKDYANYIKNIMISINTFFENNSEIANDCQGLVNYNLESERKINEIVFLLEDLNLSSLLTKEELLDFIEDTDLSGINYNWELYEEILTSKHEISDLIILKAYIDMLYNSIENYQIARSYFVNLQNNNYLNNYSDIREQLKLTSAFIEKEDKYKDIYKEITNILSLTDSVDNIDILYNFIENLYDTYLKYDFNNDNNKIITLKPEVMSIYENLINKNNNTINYYEEAKVYCDNIIKFNSKESYTETKIEYINGWLPHFITQNIKFETKCVRFNKPIIYHLRDSYTYKGN